MTKKTIHIEAIDTLFFRDGKPFAMGDDVWADGIFPPLPSVLYGAMRTAYMFQNGLSVEELEKQTTDFKISNIYLLIGNENLEVSPAFPFPYDMIKPKNQPPIFLDIENNDGINSSAYAVLKTEQKEKAEDAHGKSVLEDTSFKCYLRGLESDIFSINLSKYIISEPKIGIARSKTTRTTSGDAEGKMYRVNMQRMSVIDDDNIENIIKIGVDYEGLNDLEKNGIFRLGGENKSVQYRIVENTEINISLDNIHSNIIKVYFATPTIFENGWCPQVFLNGNLEGVSFQLLTYAIGKPLYAGGFDMKMQKPKYMFKAIPAGSVYYLQTNSIEDAKLLAQKLLAQNQINDTWKDNEQAQTFTQQGFGKIYVGTNKQS